MISAEVIIKEYVMNNANIQRQRAYIDVIKGIAIFFMLWGHCIQQCLQGSGLSYYDNSVFKFIYSFHMPLFMLVSGYLFYFSFQKRELKELVVHRSKPLLFSIVFCGAFNYYISKGLEAILTGNFSALAPGAWMSNLTSLWFLWSVLLSSIFVAIVCKKVKKVWLQLLLLMVCTAFFLIFAGVNLNLYMYPYFIIGFYFAQYKDAIPQKIMKLKYISLLVFPIMIMFYEKKHFIYTSGIIGGGYSIKENIMIDAFRWVIGIVGSVFMLSIVDLFFKVLYGKIKDNFIFNGMVKLGQNSLQIYCLSTAMLSSWLHVGFPYIVDLFGKNIFTQNMLVYNFVFTFVLSIAYSVGLYWLIKLFDKLKISKILFGK